MHKLPERKGNIYMTTEGLEALEQVSCERTREEVEATAQQIYEELKRLYRLFNREQAVNADGIICTVERKIGKTTAIIKLAEELGLPIITRRQVKDMFRDVDANIIILEELELKNMDGIRKYYHTVLVDETTDAARVRQALENSVGVRGIAVNILGVQ